MTTRSPISRRNKSAAVVFPPPGPPVSTMRQRLLRWSFNSFASQALRALLNSERCLSPAASILPVLFFTSLHFRMNGGLKLCDISAIAVPELDSGLRGSLPVGYVAKRVGLSLCPARCATIQPAYVDVVAHRFQFSALDQCRRARHCGLQQLCGLIPWILSHPTSRCNRRWLPLMATCAVAHWW